MRIRLLRPLAAGAALAVIVPIGFGAGPARAAATASGGDATSGVASVLSLSAAGHTLQAIAGSLSTSTLGTAHTAAINLAPLVVDGVSTGAVSYNQDTSDQPDVGPQSYSLANTFSLDTPSLVAKAQRTADGPIARVSGNGISSASLLGRIRLGELSGALDLRSSVQKGVSDASKSVQLSGLQLPSLASLLGILGIDLNRVPLAALLDLINTLGLTSSDFTSAQSAYDAALAAATALTTQDLSTAPLISDASYNQTSTVVPAATTSLEDALVAGNLLQSTLPTDAADWQTLGATAQAVQLLLLRSHVLTGGPAAALAITNADAALTSALDLQTALETLLNAVSNVLELGISLLSDSPLLSLGSVSVHTVADAGKTHAARVTGEIADLNVLGTDVLKAVTGKSTVDIVGLLGTELAQVQGRLDTVTGAIGTFLNAIDALTGANVAAPTITVLKKSTSLAREGAFQAARADVTALAISWPGLTLPTSVGNFNEVKLSQAVIDAAPISTFATDGFGISVATLSEHSRYTAAATTPVTPVTPVTTTTAPAPVLAQTGLPVGVSIVAALLLMAAYGVRRARRLHLPAD